MKKAVAKVFKKHGNKKIEIVKNYSPKTKAPKTTAVKGTRMDINKAIASVLLKGTKEERALLGNVMSGDYFEDFDSFTSNIIKY